MPTEKAGCDEAQRDDHHAQVISDEEIVAALEVADRGEVEIRPHGESNWMVQYSGVMEFHLGSGWKVAVFNDCLSWDYIEWIEAPDGRREEFMSRDGKTFTASEAMSAWEPKHPERWGKWSLPA